MGGGINCMKRRCWNNECLAEIARDLSIHAAERGSQKQRRLNVQVKLMLENISLLVCYPYCHTIQLWIVVGLRRGTTRWMFSLRINLFLLQRAFNRFCSQCRAMQSFGVNTSRGRLEGLGNNFEETLTLHLIWGGRGNKCESTKGAAAVLHS